MNSQKLRELREAKGYTRKQVEDATGIDRNCLARWEWGQTANPGVVEVKTLAEFYGVPVEELLD